MSIKSLLLTTAVAFSFGVAQTAIANEHEAEKAKENAVKAEEATKNNEKAEHKAKAHLKKQTHHKNHEKHTQTEVGMEKGDIGNMGDLESSIPDDGIGE